jgi:hypothetical protein
MHQLSWKKKLAQASLGEEIKIEFSMHRENTKISNQLY